jgi:hypothetical protein
MTPREAAWQHRPDLEALEEYRLSMVLHPAPNKSHRGVDLTSAACWCIIVSAVVVWYVLR